MKNAALPVGLERTAFVAISFANRAIHLRHGGWRTREKLAGFYCYVIELLAMCYCLCWSWLVDISCRPFGRHICYNVMNLQLGNCPIWQFDLGHPPTTNNTNQIHAAC